MDPRIGDFITKNRKRYTREAITQQLIEAGHDPADVQATWAALDTPDPDKAGLAGEGFWSRFYLFLVGLNVGVFLLVGLTTGMLQNLAGEGGTYAGVFALVLGIGALISGGLVAAGGPDKMGRTTATIIGAVIPLVFALLIGWSCFALVGVIPPPLPSVSGEMELQIGPPLEFEGAGAATCQPFRDGPTFVRAERLGTLDGRTVSASFDGSVFISLVSSSGADAFLELMAPDGIGTSVSVLAAADGMSGTATFEALVSMQGDPEVGPTWLSGTITWNCEAP